MKKIIIFISLFLFAVNIFGQNLFKYEVRARGGISVGLNGIKIDSISSSNDTLSFWHSGNELYQKGSGGGGVGTTVGQAFLNLVNPSAITFPRINADNSVNALSAANFKTALSLTSSDVGLGNVTNESKATMFTSPAFTGSVPTAGGVAMSRVGSGTLNLTAGDTASVALTGVTSEPYALWIIDSDGLNITQSVKDSTAVKSGVYRTWIYSLKAKTNVKVKCLW